MACVAMQYRLPFMVETSRSSLPLPSASAGGGMGG